MKQSGRRTKLLFPIVDISCTIAFDMTILETELFSPVGPQQENITDRAYLSIRDAIIEQRLAPGTRVSEAKIAAQLEVSKTPVREAMLRLVQIGLLENTGNRGTRVPEPSLERLRAAYQLREGLEAQSARLSCASRTDEEIDELLRLAKSCLSEAEMGNEAGFQHLDRHFHFRLAELTHNSLVAQHLTSSYDLTSALRMRDAPTYGFMVGCAKQHLMIAEAVRDRKPEDADRLMREHIHKVATNVISSMSNAGAEISE